MKKLFITIAAVVCTLLSSISVQADNVRIISASNGLSSQSVLKLCQVSNGFILAGTYTGLNLLNGFSCEPFGIGLSPFMTAGSMIDDIQNGENSEVWVHTNMGLEKFDLPNGTFEYHPEISGTFRLAANKNGVVVILKDDGKIFLYNKETSKFDFTGIKVPRYNNIYGFFADNNNFLHIAYNDHHVFGKINKDDEGKFTLKSLTKQKKSSKDARIKGVWYKEGTMFILDDGNGIYKVDFPNKNNGNILPTYVYNINDLIKDHGNVSAIVHDGRDIIVGFQHQGAVRLKFQPKAPKAYVEEHLPVQSGVIDILKDRNQDILWFATDGGGIYQFNHESYNFHNEIFSNHSDWIFSPSRALYRDKFGNLWVGTKGNGVLRYPDYQPFGNIITPQFINSSNSSLVNNSIYCFAPSHANILWIGTDGNALNYYSYDSQSVGTLQVGNGKMYNVHDILEVSPTEL